MKFKECKRTGLIWMGFCNRKGKLPAFSDDENPTDVSDSDNDEFDEIRKKKC